MKLRGRSAAAVLVTAVALATSPTAGAVTPAELAGWLSKSIGPISEVHKAESAAFAAIVANPTDFDALDAACVQFGDAYKALPGLVPTPAPELTAEIQQAIDGFETAMNTCDAFFVVRRAPGESDDAALESLMYDLQRELYGAEQHLATADTIIAGLTKT